MKACPACESPRHETLFEKNGFQVHACGECGCAFVSPLPSAKELRDYYALDYFEGNRKKFGYIHYAEEAPFQEESFRRKADRLDRFLQEGGRILDVGCATSTFLKQLGPRWRKFGVEISAELLKAYPPPEDARIWVGDFSDYPTAGESFDAVTFWDSLDHVRDPGRCIEKASRLLKTGGMIGINTGDRESLFARILGKNWHLYIPPTHLTFFARRSLSKLLEKHGFAVKEFEYEGRWVPLSLCFFRLSYIFENRLTRKLYEWSVRSWFRNWKVYINLFDVMTVYAVKV